MEAFETLTTPSAMRSSGEELIMSLAFQFNPQGAIGVVCAALCATLGLIISLITIYQHLLHYNVPLLQRSVIRILFITPLYSVLSFGSLIFTNAYIYLEGIRDIWEAIVVYCFLSLILDYCGGENACALVIQKDPGAIHAPKLLSKCLPPDHFKHVPILLRRTIPLNPVFVKACKRATLQFVVVKPVMAVITVIVSIVAGSEFLEKPLWLWPQAIIYNVSYSVALWALAMFYTATKSHAGLNETKPLRKFAAVKIIVFATFWQSVLMFLVYHSRLSRVELQAWNLFLLCVEMPGIALLQAWAFPVSEFVNRADPFAISARRQKCEDSPIPRQPPPPPDDSHRSAKRRSIEDIERQFSGSFKEKQQGGHLQRENKVFEELQRDSTAVDASWNHLDTVAPEEPITTQRMLRDTVPVGKAISWGHESSFNLEGFSKLSFFEMSSVNSTDHQHQTEGEECDHTKTGVCVSENAFPSFPCTELLSFQAPSSVPTSYRTPSSSKEILQQTSHPSLHSHVNTTDQNPDTGTPVDAPQTQSHNSSNSTGHFLSPPMRLPKALQKQLDAVRDPDLRRIALTNAKDVISVADVMKDAYYSFGRRYANHSLLVPANSMTASLSPAHSEASDVYVTTTETPSSGHEVSLSGNEGLHDVNTNTLNKSFAVHQYPLLLVTAPSRPQPTHDQPSAV